MRLSAGLLLCLLLIAACLQAQRVQYGHVKGTVIDSSGLTPLEAATVAVYLSSDSSLAGYALTNHKGAFTVKNIPVAQPCWYMVTYHGYNSLVNACMIPAKERELNLDTLYLEKQYAALQGVTVVAQRPPVVVRNDTLEFNAGSFTTMPNAFVEDVLKLLPGAEVDREGNITMNGKKVTKIMLDGREFFGGDPKIAMKNLPKDIIDKIQVMDNKTREARFNNRSDGNEDLAINLTLKKDKRKGWFGRTGAGYGSDNRYEGQATVNYFNASTQFNVIGNANNTNRTGAAGGEFDISNSHSTLGGGGGGLTKSGAAGLNFSNQVGKKLKMNGSYFFNSNDVENFTQSQRENLLPDTSFFYNARNRNKNDHSSHRLSLNVDYSMDSLTEFHINTSFNGNRGHSVVLNEAVTEGEKGGTLINSSENRYTTRSKNTNIATEFFFSRRFTKKGRGITLGLNYNNNDQSSVNDNTGENIFFKADTIDSRELVNQRSDEINTGKTLSLTATWSEPVLNNVSLLMNYQYNRTRNKSDKRTNRYNPATGEYDIADTLYTNAFNNDQEAHTPGMSLVFQQDKFRSSIGTGVQFLRQDNFSVTENSLLSQRYTNIAPSASIGYNFSKTANISLYYNGRNQQPSIQQLQPVPDNSNPLYIQMGNPDLQPSFYHNIRLSLRQSNGTTFWYGGFGYSSTSNQIIYETFFDDQGRQVSRPVNVNGNYGLSGNIHYSHSWKKTDWSLRLQLSGSGSYNQTTTFTNKVTNISKNYSLAPTVGFSFTWKQMFSLHPSFQLRYNNTDYSLQSVSDAAYNTKRFTLGMFWNHPRRLIIENSLQYNYNSRTAPGFQKGVTMWSAAVNWQLFKKQQGTIRVALYDILKQNAGVYRIITQSYIEDRQTQVLQRYLMVSFIYNLSKFGG